jgi:hypothetical protein
VVRELVKLIDGVEASKIFKDLWGENRRKTVFCELLEQA